MTQSPREIAAQKVQLRKQQEHLLRDLLSVVDALDRAVDHWQHAGRSCGSATPSPPARRRWWQIWLQRLGWGRRVTPQIQADTLAAMISNAREGNEMIRESMLTVLSQHQVVPLAVLGKRFDPSHMHALGQQPDGSVPPNTVVQEVVRGYLWQDRMLREAQVVVAVAPMNST